MFVQRLGWMFIVMVLCLGSVLGCSQNNTASEQSNVPASSEPAASEENTNFGAEPDETNKTDEAAAEEENASTYIVDSAWGEVELPLHPKRVVLTYHDDIDHIVALGIKPAAVPTYERKGNIDGYLPYLVDEMQGVDKIGNAPPPEAILAAEPDLIVAGYFHREMQAELEKIAPSIYFEWNTDWRKTHLEMGKALGMEDKAQANIAAFNEETEKTKAALKKTIGDEKVAFIRVRQNQLELYGAAGTGSYASMILYDWLDLTPVDEAPTDNWGGPFSLESFAEMKAEHIFLYVLENDENAALATSLLNDKLYAAVPAIQKKQVYMVDSFPWDRGGPIAFTMGMQKIREMVAGE
ncbi:hypothetical protein EBB07_15485 [Paenibacillaceae bacterium]|nr:hypothetical protein EBB07_15485 [Paenibacillaceae bacterium]